MMNPISTFRRLRDIATRRPVLVGLVGLGLLGEAARVGRVLLFGGTVTVFGHSGAEEWRTAEGESWIAGYVGWVGICGLIVLWNAVSGWRAKRRAEAGAVVVKADVDTRAARPAGLSTGSGVVVRSRRAETRWPTRLSR